MKINRYVLYIIALAGVLLLGYFLFSPQKSMDTPKTSNNQNEADMKTTKECSGKLTPVLTEGPYYKPNTPRRSNIADSNVPGERLTLTGYVYSQNCEPVANAWLDFWQADGNGNYDNVGYKLRGHQYTDSQGRYTLETVVPGEYPGRTPHIHIKIRATENSPVITSQLFLPTADQNENDSIFDETLIIEEFKDTQTGKSGRFNFVVEKR